MKRVSTDEVERFMSAASIKRPLDRALGTEHLAMNYYEVEPEEAFSSGFHAHHDQEEVFYVISGTATFDTEEGSVEVGASEAIRFAPGEFQYGYNAGDERVVALALGAPPGSRDVDIECPACGERVHHDFAWNDDRTVILVTCTACGGETARFT